MRFSVDSGPAAPARQGHRHWPPYHLVEEGIAQRAEQTMKKLAKLERLYHVGQDQIWDGRQVLAELIAKHGRPRFPDDKLESALHVLSVLLWGELAAWAISADLAVRIDDVEAKMAATSQAHDEARHFYVLRDYLAALGHPVPRLGGLGRRLLVGILKTPSLVHKLVGMQLLVESNALAIFGGLVDGGFEPVLSELLPYYERDEARHVGLGVLYLPRLLQGLSAVEATGVAAFQLRCVGLLMSAGLTMRHHFTNLGLEPRKMAERTIKLQDEILREITKNLDEPSGRHAVKGLLNPSRGLGPSVLEFLHPRSGAAMTPLHRRALDLWTRGARLADRLLA